MHPRVTDIEEKREAAGIERLELCRLAGVARKTYWSWIKRGTTPLVTSLDAVERALAELLMDRRRLLSGLVKKENDHGRNKRRNQARRKTAGPQEHLA
jgi:transcriptional regulator with XRE-family HTH domain